MSSELDGGPPGHAVEGTVDELPDGHASVTTADGFRILIRPLRPEDAAWLREAHQVPEEAARDLLVWWLPGLQGRLRAPAGISLI